MQKIATCCYCGARAALVLCGKKQHELACGRCGAPLHDLKQLPVPEPKSAPKKRQPLPKPVHTYSKKPKDEYRPKKRKPKKKRSVVSWLWDELKDEIEDIFD